MTETIHPDDGSSEPLYLTNGCCESANDAAEELLTKFGLAFGEFDGGFYPLTDAEVTYIAEDVAEVMDGHGALTGYSALYQGQKFLMPSIEVHYGGVLSETAALEYAKGLTNTLKDRIEAIGGHVFCGENDDVERHLVKVLIPFEYAQANANSFDDWKTHLEEKLLSADYKAETGLSV